MNRSNMTVENAINIDIMSNKIELNECKVMVTRLFLQKCESSMFLSVHLYFMRLNINRRKMYGTTR